MKKVFLALGLVLSTFSFAQIDFSSTRYGLAIGANYSRVRHAHNPSGPRFTGQGGGLALIPMDKNNQFYIQPELLYYGAGESGKDKERKGDPGYNAMYANNYISVPLYFKGYFSEAESEFFGMVGPRFNFLLNQKVKNPAKSFYDPKQDPEVGTGATGKANGFNFGVGVGLGYSYKRQIELAIKYDIGLSNTYKGLMKEGGVDPNISKKKSEQVLSVGLAYIFD